MEPSIDADETGRQVLDNVDIGLFIIDSSFRVSRWNRWLESRTKIFESSLLGQELFTVFPELTRRRLDRHYRWVLESRSIRVLSPAFHRYLIPMPAARPIAGIDFMQQLVKIIPLVDPAGNAMGMLTTIEDVTENVFNERESAKALKRIEELAHGLEGQVAEKTRNLVAAQEQILKSEKLSAIGEMASEIVHDINNPLSVILGFGQLLLKRPHADPKARELLDTLVREAELCRKITQNLLNFVRDHEPEKGPVDVNGAIRDALRLREYSLRLDGVAVKLHLAPGALYAQASFYQLQQVFLNIINNAQQAMASESVPRQLAIASEVQGERIQLKFQDTGPGISESVIKRIFEPFFTTKEPGKGTGLGLSVCRKIVIEHGGEIFARNADGGGAAFIIELPALAGAAALDRVEAPAVKEEPRYRVLVVDDNPAVAEAADLILQNAGHEVGRETDAQSAVQRLERESYDLILSDLRMRGLNGQEFYKIVTKHRPDLGRRFIFVTGDAVNQATREFLEGVGNPWLRKPFTLDELLEIVRSTGCRVAPPRAP